MGLSLVTPPAVEPVTLDEAKLHSRVDIDDDDSLISALIIAAREYVEEQTGRQLVAATWLYTLPAFPCGCIDLPRPPLVSVASIVYTDDNGDEQTWDAENYEVDTTSTPGRVQPVYGTVWPATEPGLTAVRVTYTAGYATVPHRARAAIKLLVGHLYEHREATIEGALSEIPVGLQRIIGTLKYGEYR